MRSRYLAVGACGATAFIDMYATQPLLPDFRRAFGASEAQVGLTISALTFACALAAPLAGPLSDRLGRKRVIVVAVALLALTTALASTAHGLPQLLAWRALQGVCMPAIFATTLAYMAEEFEPGVAGRAVAAYITGNVAGGFLGRWIAALVTARASWQAAFLVLAACNVAGGVLIALALPHERRFVTGVALRGAAAAMAGFLRRPQLLATYGIGASALFMLVATFTFATYRLAEAPFSLGVSALGNVFAVYLFGLVATPLGGRLIDRSGHRRALFVALAVVAAGTLVTLAPSLVAVLVGLGLVACGVFLAQAATQGYIGTIVSERRSSAAALYLTFYYVGGGLGAVAPSSLWARAGWPGIVTLCVAIAAAAALLARGVWRAPLPLV